MPGITLGVAQVSLWHNPAKTCSLNGLSRPQIVQLFAESVLYGLYLSSCGFSGYRLFRTGNPSRWRKCSECKWYLNLIWVTLLLTGTANIIMELLRVFRAFSSDDGLAEERLAEVSNAFNLGMVCLTRSLLFPLRADRYAVDDYYRDSRTGCRYCMGKFVSRYSSGGF